MAGKAYRKRPVTVMAIKFVGTNHVEVGQFCAPHTIKVGDDWTLLIPTEEGEMTARIGDYVIKGIKGEVYPCKPDIFEATYELLVYG